MELLDGFKTWLGSQYNCPVLIEPQRQDRAEPRWRLAASHFEKQGENRRLLNIVGTIQADGDGPGTYLSRILSISSKSAEIGLTEKGFEFTYTTLSGTYTAKAFFTLSGEGSWRENDPEEKFRYSYMEQYRIQLSYNPYNT